MGFEEVKLPALKELLDELDWTQCYFAKRFGIRQETVSRWVHDQESTPAYRLAVAYLGLRIEVMKFLRGVG